MKSFITSGPDFNMFLKDSSLLFWQRVSHFCQVILTLTPAIFLVMKMSSAYYICCIYLIAFHLRIESYFSAFH